MGKRVLRPGGLELTHQLLSDVAIDAGDIVVEFALGLGVTARLTLARRSKSYTAIERDRDAAFAWNVAWHPAARRRVLAMRGIFRKFHRNLAAIALVAKKIDEDHP